MLFTVVSCCGLALIMEDAFADIADVRAPWHPHGHVPRPPQLSIGGQSSASSSAVDAFEDVAAAGASSGFRPSFPWAAAAALAQRAFHLRAGEENRGSMHMAHLQRCRRMQRVQAEARTQAEASARVKQGWNYRVLRQGDNVAVLGGEDVVPQDRGSLHNRWNTHGFLTLAWSGIGLLHARKVCGRRRDTESSIDSSTRLQESITSLSTLLEAVQEMELAATLAATSAKSYAVDLQHDSTPMLLSFGRLQEVLMATARYLVKAPRSDGRGDYWKTVSFPECRKAFPRAKCARGVLEIWAHRSRVHWCEKDSNGTLTTHTRSAFRKPVILERANSSCMYSAGENTHGDLSISGLNDLAKHKDAWIVMAENTDVVKANKRLSAFKASLYNDRVLYAAGRCLGHRMHTVVSKSTREEDLVGHVHAVQFVSSISHRQQQLQGALWDLLDELLVVPGEPEAWWAEYHMEICSHTVLRFREGVRASTGPGLKDSAIDHCEGLRTVCNGPWWLDRVTIYDHGQFGCLTRAQWIAKVHAAMCQAGLLGAANHTVLAKSRWGTCNSANGAQTLGKVCHRVGPRTFQRAFPKWEHQPPREESEDFHLNVRSKIFRSTLFLNDEGLTRTASNVVWVAEPLDHALQKVQKESEAGGFLLAILHSDTNLFDEAQRAYVSMICLPIAKSKLHTLWTHYKMRGEDLCAIALDLLALTLSLAGGLWLLCEVFLESPPFGWARAVDPREPDPEARIHEMLSLHECCQDDHMTGKIRSVHSNARSVFEDEDLLNALRLWTRFAYGENMGCERLLALFRKACAMNDNTPSAARLISIGLAAQWLSVHRSAKGEEPAVTTRSQLLRRGMPILAAATKQPVRHASPELLYSNAISSKRKSQGVTLTRDERYAEIRAATLAYNNETPEVQEEFARKARAAELKAKAKRDVGDDSEQRYAQRIGQRLWGASSLEGPLREDVVDSTMQRLAPSGCDMRRGFADGLSEARKRFLARSCQAEEEGIPKSLKVLQSTTCAEAHWGFCVTRDRLYWHTMCSAKKTLDDSMHTGACALCRLGCAFMLRGTWSDSERRDKFFLLAFKQNRPRETVWCEAKVAPLEALGDCVLPLVSKERRRLRFTTSAMVQTFFALVHKGGLSLSTLEMRQLDVKLIELDSQAFRLAGLPWPGHGVRSSAMIYDSSKPLPRQAKETTPEVSALAAALRPSWLLDKSSNTVSNVGDEGDVRSKGPPQPTKPVRTLSGDSSDGTGSSSEAPSVVVSEGRPAPRKSLGASAASKKRRAVRKPGFLERVLKKASRPRAPKASSKDKCVHAPGEGSPPKAPKVAKVVSPGESALDHERGHEDAGRRASAGSNDLMTWGGFAFKRLNTKGVFSGVSAECKMHTDGTPNDCARGLFFGPGYDQARVVLHLKRWLVLGFQFADDDRASHMSPLLAPRKLQDNPSPEQLELAESSGRFTAAELDELR